MLILYSFAFKRAIEPYQKQKSKERQRTLNNEETASGNLPEVKGDTRDIIAKFVGVGRTTLQKAEDIVNAAEQCFSRFVSI